ncbi:MAG: transcriptional regulator, partial [Oscillospiraceae bacterium]
MSDKNEKEEKIIKQTEITNNTLSKVNDNMPPDEILYDLAELFKIFGDSTRIKI